MAERYDLRPAPPVEAFEEHTTPPAPWTPTLDELLGCHHSQNGFVLEKLAQAAAFDGEVAEVVRELVPIADGRFQLDVTAKITWGRPCAGTES